MMQLISVPFISGGGFLKSINELVLTLVLDKARLEGVPVSIIDALVPTMTNKFYEDPAIRILKTARKWTF